jgi:hypothetical protein
MLVTIREMRQEIRVQIGESIEAYAPVEAKQAFLLKSILNVDYRKACIIFFAVQNVRARGEMIQDLLGHKGRTFCKPASFSAYRYQSVRAPFANQNPAVQRDSIWSIALGYDATGA